MFKAKPIWSREDIANLAACTGLTRSQVYKWNWDMRKKFCPNLPKPQKVKKRSPKVSPREFVPPLRNRITLETIKEVEPLFPPISTERTKKKILFPLPPRNITPLPKINSSSPKLPDITPYFEQNSLPEKKKKKIKLRRIEKLQKKFEIFTLSESLYESEQSTRTSGKTAERSP